MTRIQYGNKGTHLACRLLTYLPLRYHTDFLSFNLEYYTRFVAFVLHFVPLECMRYVHTINLLLPVPKNPVISKLSCFPNLQFSFRIPSSSLVHVQ